MDTTDHPPSSNTESQNPPTQKRMTEKEKIEKPVVDFQIAKSPHLLLKKEKKIAATRAAFEKYYPTSKVVKKARKKSKPLKK
jgi:hypothetical protein